MNGVTLVEKADSSDAYRRDRDELDDEAGGGERFDGRRDDVGERPGERLRDDPAWRDAGGDAA